MIKNTEATKRPSYIKILVIASIMMTVGGTLTAIMTYKNVGLTENFMTQWLSSFVIATVIMMPIGWLFMSLIGKVVQFFMSNSKTTHQQLVTGLSMALIMETVMAISTTANTLGFSNTTTFISAWAQAFITALPFGLFMSVMMSLFFKPRLAKFLAS
ncbi:hypothetical protein MAMP_00606 [Methylophaga aminisulfidivorans MP]|uniref:DUF2798 domain-containing protein n=1 Tax=Methylophaga aminisulfidivorans MP TaxID=1026882 RepID=F5SYE9_9GAMM|nr:DUF2798 domain-containing protein [Methylophaga aminisulfidivorans]EGL54217.1 hypothetical protein MAMP_00606 [Methylophaga aminisulfidivorans MP]